MPKQMSSPLKSVGSVDTSDTAASKAPTKEGSVTLQYPMRIETNFGSWAVKMKVSCTQKGCGRRWRARS